MKALLASSVVVGSTAAALDVTSADIAEKAGEILSEGVAAGG